MRTTKINNKKKGEGKGEDRGDVERRKKIIPGEADIPFHSIGRLLASHCSISILIHSLDEFNKTSIQSLKIKRKKE